MYCTYYDTIVRTITPTIVRTVLNCRRFGLRWEYIPQNSAVLLDKIYKFEHNTTYELGGDAAVRVLQQRGATAVHATCYEQKSKVMGLKVITIPIYIYVYIYIYNSISNNIIYKQF